MILRSSVRSLFKNKFLASCCVIDEPPCTTPPAFALVTQRAHGAGDIDAEMLVEAAILGRQHRLDQIVGKLVERHRIVVADAARADLVAVAVEEGHREFGLLQPVAVGGLAEGRDGERQHQHGADGAEGGGFRDELVEPAPPAGDVEAVHEGGKALIGLAQAGEAAEQAGIDAGVEAEHAAS